MKSYTDLEQSKVLAKILPLESADMYWFRDNVEVPRMYPKDMMKDSVSVTCPCWSLSALLKVMPFWYDIHPVKNGVAIKCDYGKEEIVISDNHVDACVGMVERLYKLKLL